MHVPPVDKVKSSSLTAKYLVHLHQNRPPDFYGRVYRVLCSQGVKLSWHRTLIPLKSLGYLQPIDEHLQCQPSGQGSVHTGEGCGVGTGHQGRQHRDGIQLEAGLLDTTTENVGRDHFTIRYGKRHSDASINVF